MTRLAVVGGLCAGACLIGAALLQPAAGAEPAQARVVDRTLLCATGVAVGARSVTVTARSGVRVGGRLDSLGEASVVTPGQPVPSRPSYLPTLAGVTAGWPPPAPLDSGALGHDTRRCRQTSARVPLTRRGLRGGRASAFGEEVKCRAPREVLVRVRATFASPTPLEPNDEGTFVSAAGRIEVGRIAVRTRSGTQLVYADVLDSGRARLFTARSCF